MYSSIQGGHCRFGLLLFLLSSISKIECCPLYCILKWSLGSVSKSRTPNYGLIPHPNRHNSVPESKLRWQEGKTGIGIVLGLTVEKPNVSKPQRDFSDSMSVYKFRCICRGTTYILHYYSYEQKFIFALYYPIFTAPELNIKPCLSA